jgi:hypothetical protein
MPTYTTDQLFGQTGTDDAPLKPVFGPNGYDKVLNQYGELKNPDIGAAPEKKAYSTQELFGHGKVPTQAEPAPAPEAEKSPPLMSVLPEWAQTAHSYLDPNRVFAGKAGQREDLHPVEAVNMLSMALPAGKGPIKAPTEKALMDAGGAGYTAGRNSTVAMNGGALTSKMKNFQTGLRKAGQGPVIAPKTNSILDDLQQGIHFSDGKSMSVGDYISFRQVLQHEAQGTGQEALAATKAIKRLDNLFDTTSPLNFSGASRAEIDHMRTTVKDARENFSAGYRSRTVTNKLTDVEQRANATNSGLNVDNPIRAKMRGLITPDTPSGTTRAGRSGYSADEQREMARINKGSRTINAARDVGNMLGGGGGIGRVVSGGAGGAVGGGIGMLVGGPPGAAVGAAIGGTAAPVVGLGLKLAENAAAKKSMTQLANSVRLRSPLGAATKQPTYNENTLAIKLLSLLNYLPEGQ